MPNPSAPGPCDVIRRPRVPAWIPHPRHAPILAARAAATWAALRLALFLAIRREPYDPPLRALVLEPAAAFALIAAVAVALWVDARRKREVLLYLNPCMGPAWRVGIAVAVAGTAEVCVALFLR